MSNLATSMMADIVNYTQQLRGWSRFVWCMFSPQKWWVHGYERGWMAALQLAEGQKTFAQQAKTKIKPMCLTCRNHIYERCALNKNGCANRRPV